MKYVYGPILSRRLGQSLGVDPIPLKTCNWNCVYCQLGRTVPLTSERKDYFPPEEIFGEVKAALEAYQPYQIDWVSIVGSGEPLLCASVGWLIRQIKAVTKIPVAVITCGSLLYRPEVRQDTLPADAVLPSLNAGSPELYRKISRPHPEITFEKYIDGLIQFRKEYQGKLWLEIMLIKGLNDTEEALRDIAGVLEKVRPDEVHVNLPVRAPAEPWVEPSDPEGVKRALAILGDKVSVLCPVIYVLRPMNGNLVFSHCESLVDEIAGIVLRHPVREGKLVGMLSHWSPEKINATLKELKADRRIKTVRRYGQHFLCAASAHYADQ